MAQLSRSSIQFTTVRDFQVWASAAHSELVKVEVSSSILGEFLQMAHLITHHCPELVVIPSSSALSGAERRPSSPPSKAATPLSSIPPRPVASNSQAVSPRTPYRQNAMADGEHPPLPLDRPRHGLYSGCGYAAYWASPAPTPTSVPLAPTLEPFPILGDASVIRVLCRSSPSNFPGWQQRGFRRVWGELRDVRKCSVLGHGFVGMLSLRILPGELSKLPHALVDALRSIGPSILDMDIPGEEWEVFKDVCTPIMQERVYFQQIRVNLYGREDIRGLDMESTAHELLLAFKRKVLLSICV
ncbi:hypothetical protein OH76DRAFT_1192316 [Lentinus brumalis]|uniref:Uncharacterized protein n=1 Tax=Lentinus brumalis TaxID=2498619 RepID=A0A371CTM1_9APHY|nr:hypothetical protein OH76DRAFT_1192316 [Polyporus brumalis]